MTQIYLSFVFLFRQLGHVVFCFNFSDCPYSLLGPFRGLQKGALSAVCDTHGLLRRAERRVDTKCTVRITLTSASCTLLKWSYRLIHRGITLLIAVYIFANAMVFVLLHHVLLRRALMAHRTLPCFSQSHHKRHDIWKQTYRYEMCCNFLYKFYSKLFHFRKNSARYDNVRRSSCKMPDIYIIF